MYPFPCSIHHIYSDHFSGLWSHSRWWSRAPQPYVCSGTDQRWWHSIWCCLHTGGRCRTLHSVGTGTPQRCSSVFISWISHFIFFHGWNAGCSTWGSQSNSFMQRTSATHVRAFIMVRDGEHSGAQPPTPDRGKNLHHTLMTPTQVGGLHINCRQTLGTLVMPSYGNSWRTSTRR